MENGLEQARNIINEADREMAILFEKRMNAVKSIALYKKERGLPIQDEKRERQVLAQNAAYIENPAYSGYYARFLSEVMKISRGYQSKLNEGMRVAYCGTPGAFAYTAAEKIFPDAQKTGYSDFASAYQAVQNGACDVCVLPIENSCAGEVGQVSDLMFQGTLFINGVYELGISHDLLGVKGATLKDITAVASHPQALNQCSQYIKRLGVREIPFQNTALAAKYVAEQNDKHLAAVAGEDNAPLYGLSVLARGIHTSFTNTTKFAVLSLSQSTPTPGEQGLSFSLTFTVKNEAGALARALNIIGSHGYNLGTLRSRPMRNLMWQYYFYAQADGNIGNSEGKSMLEEMKVCCDDIKVLGSYHTVRLNKEEEEA